MRSVNLLQPVRVRVQCAEMTVNHAPEPADPPATRVALPMALLRAREAVMARFRPILADHGITEQQWRVIRVVAEAGRIDATDLAARANILAPSLTRMLKAMTLRDLIARAKDKGDARRQVLTITPNGEALIRAVTPHSAQVYRGIEAEFGAKRTEQLLGLLNDLAALGRANA
jgi:homoprotocatechuate degradation regulator HpaR